MRNIKDLFDLFVPRTWEQELVIRLMAAIVFTIVACAIMAALGVPRVSISDLF